MSKRKKEPTVTVNKATYLRIPIKTKIITEKDNLLEIIKQYAQDKIKAGDILVLGESMVAISQGRAIPEHKIKIGLLAKLIWRGVRKVSYGVGLRSPASMQCAIDEAGKLRILIAGFVGFIGKVLGFKGVFYRIAGMQAALIDAAHTTPIPPYQDCVIKGPLHPEKVASQIKEKFGCEVAIMDVNDIGGSWAIAYTEGIDKKIIEAIMKDNPLGQSDELTPIGIIRRL